MKKIKLLTSISALGLLVTTVPVFATSCDKRETYTISNLSWSSSPHVDNESILDSYTLTKDDEEIDPETIKSISVSSDSSPELLPNVNNNICSIYPKEPGTFNLSLIIETKDDKFKVSTDITVANHQWTPEYYFIIKDTAWIHYTCSCGETYDRPDHKLTQNEIIVDEKTTESATTTLNNVLGTLSTTQEYVVYLPTNATIDLTQLTNLNQPRKLILRGRQGSTFTGTASFGPKSDQITFECVTFASDIVVTLDNGSTPLESFTVKNSVFENNTSLLFDADGQKISNVIVDSCIFGKIDESKYKAGSKHWTSLLLYVNVDNLTVTNSIFNGAIYNAIQTDGAVNKQITIENNIFSDIENRVMVLTSTEQTSYTIQKNLMINCNPYKATPEKYNDPEYTWPYHPGLIRVTGCDAKEGEMSEQTIQKGQFDRAKLDYNYSFKNNELENVEFYFLDPQKHPGIESGFTTVKTEE